MSSFKDTFTKDQPKENLLKYDGTASLFFFCTVLLCVTVPFTYTLIRDAFFPESKFNEHFLPVSSKKGSKIRYCECSACKSKVDQARKDTSSFTARFSSSFIIRAVLVISAWVIIAGLIYAISTSDTNVASFDPYQILGVAVGSSEKDIKKAYRKMSLEFHPDRNPNNPQAQSIFMLISRAQAALLDPEARANYEKWGNPDGPSTMKIGIGLPPWLVASENNLIVLITFFLVLVIGAPVLVISYWQKMKGLHACGLQVESVHELSGVVSKHTRGLDMPEFLALTSESRALPLRPSEDKLIEELGRQCKHLAKPRFKQPILIRNMVLYQSYLNRLTDQMTPELKAQTMSLIKSGSLGANVIVDACVLRRFLANAIETINFKRQLTHAIPFAAANPSLLQIPHMNAETVANLTKPGKAAVNNLAEFVALKPEDRHAILPASFTDKQRMDIDLFCETVTDIEISADVETLDENEICVGDVATVTAHVTRRNLADNEAQGSAHAPFYPGTKTEELSVFLINLNDPENPFAGFMRVKSQEKKEDVKIQIRVEKPGMQKYRVLVLSDSYWGVDKDVIVTFNALSPEAAGRQVFVHPEDVELEKAPTLMQRMMDLQQEDQNESDDEEEEVQGNQVRAIKKPQQASQKQAAASAKAGEEDGEVDSEDELSEQE